MDERRIEQVGPSDASDVSAPVELLWIPLGAGERVVRVSGRLFESLSALVQRRRPCDLYHSALVFTVPSGRFVVEMAPIPDRHGDGRGVVAEGPVGAKWAGRFRIFRYEIRRWPDGVIPDAGAAVAIVKLGVGAREAQQLLDLLPSVPTPVWGRDELDLGDMWNSNSVVSWLLLRGGIDAHRIELPRHGRAPGWSAGLAAAERELVSAASEAERRPGSG